MEYKIEYIDNADRLNKLNENADKFLIGEQNIKEGNFLIFTDTKPMESQMIDAQDNQLTIMDSIATIYEGLLAKGSI